LNIGHICEDVSFNISCNIFAVNPGKGYIVFEIKLDDHVLGTSNDNELEESIIDSDGVKSVTYTEKGITLNRTANGKTLKCKAMWRGSTNVAPEETTLDITCICNFTFIIRVFIPSYLNVRLALSGLYVRYCSFCAITPD
jgi:hypothetical protein